MSESLEQAAHRIAHLSTFSEQVEAANEYAAVHPLPDIYVFYRLINEEIQALWLRRLRA